MSENCKLISLIKADAKKLIFESRCGIIRTNPAELVEHSKLNVLLTSMVGENIPGTDVITDFVKI